MNFFKEKTLLITGGTGSFGNAVLRKFLDSSIGEIRIFSRDEKKQDDMRRKFNNPKIKFYIGDVRDLNAIQKIMRGVDFVFHAAALKQVPSCEFHPMQAVQTNIIGTENIIQSAINAGVKRIICLSTDKAVYPINAMGISKAMMEKVMIASSRNLDGLDIVICGTRYGNVMASRGSVIPLFVDQILASQPITITDPTMTRFMMTLDDAVNLVLYAFQNGSNGDIFVQKSPAATIEVLVNAILNIMGRKEYDIKIIGARHGEKLYETLLSKEEMFSAIDLGNYYQIPSDARDLNYEKFYDTGNSQLTKRLHEDDYNSNNTRQLNVSEMQSLLLELDFMKQISRGEPAIAED
jgi:UDP-glucose 4-epimerase